MTAISVGPASRSMPTSPNSWRLASATYALPAPDDHVGRRQALDAEGHRGERLDAAEREDLVGARRGHRVEHRRVDPAAAARRRARDHALDARRPSARRRHERRGEHRVAPAGHVGADGAHRDVAVAERHARQRLDLEVAQRLALRCGEGAHLLLGEGDVLAQLVVERSPAAGDRRLVDDERRRVPAVELARVVADRVDRPRARCAPASPRRCAARRRSPARL